LARPASAGAVDQQGDDDPCHREEGTEDHVELTRHGLLEVSAISFVETPDLEVQQLVLLVKISLGGHIDPAHRWKSFHLGVGPLLADGIIELLMETVSGFVR
jgi:hypothetical protein